MGAGASALDALPAQIDRATAKTIAGEKFDETAFDAAAKDGSVSREAFVQAAGISALPDEAGGKAVGKTAAVGKAAG